MATDIERVSGILAEDAIHGFRIAAARAGVTVRTVQRYRKLLESDEALSQRVAEKKAVLLEGWEDEARLFMRKCLAKMSALVDVATLENLRDVNGSAKIVGELMVAQGVLGGGQSSADSEGAAPQAPPSGVRASDFN